MQHTLHKLSTFAAEEKMKGGSLDICPAREYKKHRPLIHYMSLVHVRVWQSSYMNDRSVQRGFINVSSRMAIGLHRQAKAFELTFFVAKISL